MQLHLNQSVDGKVHDIDDYDLSKSAGSDSGKAGGPKGKSTTQIQLAPIEVVSRQGEAGVPARSPLTSEQTSGDWAQSWNRDNDDMSRTPNFKIPSFSGAEGDNHERFFDEMAGLQRIYGWGSDEYLQIIMLGIKGRSRLPG